MARRTGLLLKTILGREAIIYGAPRVSCCCKDRKEVERSLPCEIHLG